MDKVEGPRSARQGAYRSAGRGAATSQTLPCSFPKISSQSRKSGPVWAEGEGDVLKAKVALAAARTASLLSSIPASELQLPRWQAGYDQGTALRQGIPGNLASRGVLQPSTLPKEAGVERNLGVSDQAEGRGGDACP